MNTLSRWLTGPHVVREEVRIAVEGPDSPPFRTEAAAGLLILEFSSAARLVIRTRSRFHSRILHSAELLQLLSPTAARLRVPESARLEVSDPAGRLWKVSVSAVPSRSSFDVQEWSGLLRPAGIALGTHFAALVLLGAGFQIGKFTNEAIEEMRDAEKMKVASILAAGSGRTSPTAGELRKPFSGIGLREFERLARARDEDQRLKSASAAERIGSLRKMMAGMAPSRTKSLGEEFGSRKKSASLPVRSGFLDQSMKENRAETAAALAANARPKQDVSTRHTAAPTALSEAQKQELALRSRMEQLRPLLTEAYDEVLRSNPGLSVTLSYAGTVGSDGRIAEVRLTVEGGGTSPSVELLKRKVTSRILGFRVGSSFAGLSIRGEHAFIR